MRKFLIAAIASTAFVALPVAAQETTSPAPGSDTGAAASDPSATALSASTDATDTAATDTAAKSKKSKKHKKSSPADAAASTDAGGSASSPAEGSGVSNWSPSEVNGAGSSAAPSAAPATPGS